MQKTVCDRCGAECVNYRARLYGEVQHTTSDGQVVGEEIVKPLDLCKHCTDHVQADLGLAIASLDKTEYDSAPRWGGPAAVVVTEVD